MSIISPWVFYLIGISSNINTFCLFAFPVLLIVFIISPVMVSESEDTDIAYIFKGKVSKIFLTLLLATGVGTIFIPSKHVCYEMLVASYITYENVDTASDIIKESVDYIFERTEGTR